VKIEHLWWTPTVNKQNHWRKEKHKNYNWLQTTEDSSGQVCDQTQFRRTAVDISNARFCLSWRCVCDLLRTLTVDSLVSWTFMGITYSMVKQRPLSSPDTHREKERVIPELLLRNKISFGFSFNSTHQGSSNRGWIQYKNGH